MLVAREFEFTDKEFSFLSELVSNHAGIMLPKQKRDMVYGRLAKRLRTLKLDSFEAYCDLLRSDAGQVEMGNLVNAITTNLTGFFREAHHFTHLMDDVLPRFAKKNDRLRLWSAGCSTGAEPYSMAMCLREAIPDVDRRDAKILATDIDTHVLSIGREGIYGDDMVNKAPEELREKYFHSVGHHQSQADTKLRSLIAFKHLNLLGSWPMKGKFDIIFCRNVVIYFNKGTQATLFNRFADRLNPGGWLYIGHSETLHNVCDRFRLIGKTVYQKVE